MYAAENTTHCLYCGSPAVAEKLLFISGFSSMRKDFLGGIQAGLCGECIKKSLTPKKAKATVWLIGAVLGILMVVGMIILVLTIPGAYFGLFGIIMIGSFVGMCFKKMNQASSTLKINPGELCEADLISIIGNIRSRMQVISPGFVVFNYQTLKENIKAPIDLSAYHTCDLQPPSDLETLGISGEEKTQIEKLIDRGGEDNE